MKRIAPLACALALMASHGGAAAFGATAAPPMRPVMVRLDAQASLSGLPQPRAQRVKELVTRLQHTASASQSPVLQLLATRRRQGLVGRVRPLWVMNAVAVTATQSVIDELRAMPPVASVTPDGTGIVPAASPPQWNISLVNAPAWDRGLRPGGRRREHGHGCRSRPIPTCGQVARWHEQLVRPQRQHPTRPIDFSGHGTQTMGVMVGGNAGGSSIGVAPDARWIAAKIFNDRGTATSTGIHQGFQWLLDPDRNPSTADAPNVVNNSWTMMSGQLHARVPARLASPPRGGDRAGVRRGQQRPNRWHGLQPGQHPSALAVGSTYSVDVIANDSSRGPPHAAAPARTFPSLVAPGVGIRTSDLFSGYTTQSGTSLAAPHVAGALALLLSAHPGLSAAAQETALTSTAVDLGTAGVDNAYGAGRIDIAAALGSLGSDKAGPVVGGLAVPAGGSAVTGTATDALSNVAGGGPDRGC